MDEQMKFFKFLGSPDGIFQENELLAFEDSMFPQFYEMDMWIYARLCQNPDAELNGLIADFLNGYYGAAGPALRKYMEEIHSRLPRFQYRFFDYAFMDAGAEAVRPGRGGGKERRRTAGPSQGRASSTGSRRARLAEFDHPRLPRQGREAGDVSVSRRLPEGAACSIR